MDTAGTKTVVGPQLVLDAKTEQFTGPNATVAAAANKNPLLKRAGRGAFAIPGFQA